MLFLRVVGILAAIAIGAGIIAFLFTGERRYLGFSWRIAKYALIFALVLFALLAFERLLVMI
ncbi:MAG: hypothetical protein ACK4E4_00350 [Rhodocyclaceae bacterium]